MPQAPKAWERRLSQQQAAGLFRKPLPKPVGFADFCSNDFLGLASRPVQLEGALESGATGSRHVSGLHSSLEELEAWAGSFWGAERAMYFPTGFQGNLGVIQALATRHDTLLMDERIHASLRDAARSTLAQTHFFRHNSPEDLGQWLSKTNERRPADGEIYVVTEGVFSMAGTHAPLADMAAICRQYNAYLIIDEAHSIGLYGQQGRGLVAELGLQEEVLVQIFPLGKAAGTQGSLVVGSQRFGQMLENFSRPLIYSTAPAPVLTHSALQQLKAMAAADAARKALAEVENGVKGFLPDAIAGAIQPIRPSDDGAWPELLGAAQEVKLWVKPIRYPTVPKEEACMRLTLHAYQTEEELVRLKDWVETYQLRTIRVEEGN